MVTKRERSRLSPRKAPRQERAAATVAILLEAAARILERKGLEGYNTNAVATKAGVSIGSLYQYFPNKDALTVALIERETAQLLLDVDAVAETTGFIDGMRGLVAAAVAHQLRRPALARCLDFEEGRLPMRARDMRVGARIEGALKRCFACADAPVLEDMDIAAADTLAIVRGMVDAAGERGEADSVALAARVLRAVLGYLTRS
jgi:AcrR family transcriptional regulator